MPRIRTIKPEFFKHVGLYKAEQKYGVPYQLRVLYPGLWACADREGRFRWNAWALKSDIMPYDQDVDFEELLEILVAEGFIVRYVVGTEVYGCIPTLTKHQRIRADEAASLCPAPTLSNAGHGMSAYSNVTVTGPSLRSDGSVTTGITHAPTPIAEDHSAATSQTTTRADRRRGNGNGSGNGSGDSMSSNGEKRAGAGRPPYQAIIDYLNHKAGTHHSYNAEATRALIRARWNEGHTLEDFQAVIDDRCNEWLYDDRMAQYLRPATLFNATKFPNYLGNINAHGRSWADSRMEIE